MSDLVSRQKVIEVIDAVMPVDPNKSEYASGIACGAALAMTYVKQLPSAQQEVRTEMSSADTISRQAAIDKAEEWIETYNSERGGQRERDAIKHVISGIKKLPPAQPTVHPQRTCVNCGRTVNNGGWYADGGTRCPIEEHYALPKDGYCYLWEKRNITDDDYPERRTDEE